MSTINFQTGQQYTYYNLVGTMSNVSGISVIDHGAWDPTEFYAEAARDAVSYEGNYFICLRPNTGQRPPSGVNRNAFWSRVLGVEAEVYVPPTLLPTLSSLSDRITALETDDTSLPGMQNAISDLQDSVGANASSISSLQTSLSTNSTSISKLQANNQWVFNVQNYGTGVGAGNAAVDTPAIAAAFAAWSAAGRGILYFPAGTYYDTGDHILGIGNGGHGMSIQGDNMYTTQWVRINPTGSTFLYAFTNISDIQFVAQGATGWNVGYRCDISTFGVKLENVKFQGWSVGWWTDSAGAEGSNLDFTQCTIGMKAVGYADGCSYKGRFDTCTVGALISCSDNGSANGTVNRWAHCNRFQFEGPTNKYVYVFGSEAIATVGGYFEKFSSIVSIGFPPDIVSLDPTVTERTIDTLTSVIVDGLAGFHNVSGSNPADSVVTLYQPCQGVTIRNSGIQALDLVKSTTTATDLTPIVLEHCAPGVTYGARTTNRVITYSDGTGIDTWMQGTSLVSAEINSTKRFFIGKSQVLDPALDRSQLYNTVMGHTDPLFSTAPDTDAASFYSAGNANISDTTIQSALSKLCKDLKLAGLWSTKFYALYPLVGNNSNACAFNLINPSTFKITWHGTPTFDTTGLSGGSTTNYGDTGIDLASLSGASATNMALFVYLNSASLATTSPQTFFGVNSTNRAGIGVVANGSNAMMVCPDGFMDTYAINTFAGSYQSGISASTDYRGPYAVQRTDSGTNTMFYPWRSTYYKDQITGTPALPTTGGSSKLYLLCKDDGGPYQATSATIAMAGVAQAFTQAEWNKFKVIVDNFCALLGRKGPW